MLKFIKFFLIVPAVVHAFVCCPNASAEERKLIVSLKAAEEYNDNIFFNFDDKIDDFITTLTGGLKLGLRTERTDLNLAGEIDSLFYAEQNDLDDLDQFYSGRFSHLLTDRLKALLEASYTRDSRPDRDIDVTGQVLGTAIREKQWYRAAADYVLTDITTGTFSYQYDQEDYDDPEFVDYNYHRVGLGLSRRLDQYFLNTTGRLNFNYATYDYPTTRIDYYSGTIGMLRELTELWRLLIDIGARYNISKFDDLGGESTSEGWGGVGTIEFSRRGEYLFTSLSVSHDIGAASGQDGSVERTSAVLNLSYAFTEDFRMGMTAGYYINFTEADDLARQNIDEETANLKPWMRFGLTDWLSIEASFTHTRLDDNVVNDTAYRNLYLLELAADYPLLE